VSTAILTLSDIRKSYQRQPAVEIAALTFHEGERVLISGSNGSGKSTLLRALAGVARLDAGRIERDASLRRGRVGFVPQSGGLWPESTLRRNLALRRQVYGRPPADPAAAWYVNDLGLLSVLDHRVGELSGGYQRLAGFAAALSVDPDWLLLDEPFDGLDDARRECVLDGLRRVAGSQRLIVIAGPRTEEWPDATRIVRLREGRLA
jgi:ABC-type multidrug transport system ATPase subunit